MVLTSLVATLATAAFGIYHFRRSCRLMAVCEVQESQ
jgi:hypothetical protein